MDSNMYEVHFQVFGSIPVSALCDVLAVCVAAWKDTIVLSSDHPVSQRTGALMSIVTKK